MISRWPVTSRQVCRRSNRRHFLWNTATRRWASAKFSKTLDRPFSWLPLSDSSNLWPSPNHLVRKVSISRLPTLLFRMKMSEIYLIRVDSCPFIMRNFWPNEFSIYKNINQYKRCKFILKLINLLSKLPPFIHSEWGGCKNQKNYLLSYFTLVFDIMDIHRSSRWYMTLPKCSVDL